MGKSGWNETDGISVVIENTEKGKKYLSSVGNIIDLKLSEFNKAAVGNKQLLHPSDCGRRSELLAAYRQGGWAALEEQYNKSIGWYKYSSQLKTLLPQALKRV